MKKNESKNQFSIYKAQGDKRIINCTYHDNEMEIIEVREGKVTVQIGTDVREAVAGDIFCVPPQMVLRIDSVGGNAAIRGIVFDMSILTSNLEHFDTEILYMFDVQSKNKIVIFGKDHALHERLSSLIADSANEYAEKDVCYKLPIRANIYLIMSALLRYYCGTKDDADRAVYHNVIRFRPVVEHLGTHFTEKMYIEELASLISVSPDYFTKMFRDVMGTTPIDYINAMRVNLSMLLLFSTEMSMAEIAETVGFCNPNYFHKIFKQYMGTSPLAYRKSSL